MPNKKNGLSSAEYYKLNPESYAKKKAAQKKINARPEERAKRSELIKRNAAADKRGVDRTGKDYDHGSKRYIASSTNRGKTSGTPGDRKARGGKKK